MASTIPLAPVTRPKTMPQATFESLKSKAQEMEGLFINTLVKEMFAGLDSRGALGGGYAEETWRGLMAEQYSQEIAEAGGLGLTNDLMHQLIKAQAGAQPRSGAEASLIGAYQK